MVAVVGPGQASAPLVLHAIVVLWAGLLSGVGFWLTLILHSGEDRVRAWRVAHGTLVTMATLMLVVSLILPRLSLTAAGSAVAAGALIVSAYGFVLALAVGALGGVRGLTAKPWGLNTLFFAAHVVGVVGAFVAAALLAWGAFGALHG